MTIWPQDLLDATHVVAKIEHVEARCAEEHVHGVPLHERFGCVVEHCFYWPEVEITTGS